MRRANKEIKDRAVIVGLLGTAIVGRLGTIGKEGRPMVKPLNFVFHHDAVYFHTAKEGEKIDDIRRDNRVCFEIDHPIAYVQGAPENPCKAEYLYRSVIIRGRAVMVEDRDERVGALKAMMHKYQPEGGYGAFLEEKLAVTGVVRIDIEEMTGKEDLGKEYHRDMIKEAIMGDAHLPIILEP
ncbi:MAG: pyridoxamine 5'-phosphate oxidase family protein [Nitrospiraceae bacterium]|nr:pyridoxamine 5'-phosphate oxidase family protein [Nitrospiraceae bacterium]